MSVERAGGYAPALDNERTDRVLRATEREVIEPNAYLTTGLLDAIHRLEAVIVGAREDHLAPAAAHRSGRRRDFLHEVHGHIEERRHHPTFHTHHERHRPAGVVIR